MKQAIFFLFISLLLAECKPPQKNTNGELSFPPELVNFVPYKNNPLFTGTNKNTWDSIIRERGYILREDSMYYIWYTGYRDINDTKYLGLATSKDGYNWIRYQEKPIYEKGWIEDMCVVKKDDTYYMFAEGKGDTAHLLTSKDRINWTEQGNLDIRMTNGNPISKGSFGTPTVIFENNTWYLFYERGDLGIWLASSKDLKKWINVQDEPVINMGPETYDKYAVAMNYVIKYKGFYYGYYHSSAFKDWHEWSTNIAVSKDLIHWKKYEKNPIVGNDKSSGILVNDGSGYRLYTMHPDVNVYLHDQ